MIESGLDELTYRNRPGLSQSALKLLGTEGGPAKVRYGDPSVATRAQKFGTLIHLAILQPHLLERHYVPTRLEREGTKAWVEAEIAAMGRRLVKQADYDKARIIADSVRRWSTTARDLLDASCEVEQSFFWEDPDFPGLQCKGRADGVNRRHRALIDVKSAVDGSYQGFRRACLEHGYHIQDAYYERGYPLAGGFVPAAFVFVVVEKDAPYLSAAYILEPPDIEAGRAEVRRLIDIHQDCVRTGIWPGYSQTLQRMSLARQGD